MKDVNTVLLIMPNGEAQKTAAITFEEQKYRVINATNSNEARLKFGNEAFHMVVIDLALDNFMAKDFVEQIRRKESLKHMKDTVPVLIISEQPELFTEKFSQMDYVKYLEAPFTGLELKKKLLTFTGHSSVISDNTRIVEKDEYLITEGGTNHEMYWVLAGEFIITKSNQDNQNVILGKVVPGEVVGEMSFLDSLPRSASVKATMQSEILVIPHKKFIDVLDNQPRWFRSLMQTLSQRLRTANAKIARKVVDTDTDKHSTED